MVLGLLTSVVLNSQNCEHQLTGEVIDFHDNTPLLGATVHLKELDKYTTTDTLGGFKFEDLCDGTYTLVISHLACETKETAIVIANDDVSTKVMLEHHIEELEEITVSGNKIKKTVTAQETVIDNETITNYSAGSLGDALKEVSGVASINTGNTIVKPIINGLHSSRIITMNNNVRLQDQEWGIEHAPNIDINAVDNISVIKGANALIYGSDAIGGVVVLNPKKVVKKDSLFGNTILGVQSNGRGISLTSSLTKSYKNGWFIDGQGSFKRSGDFKAPDYYLTNTGLNSKALSAQFGYNTFEKGFDIYYSYLNNELGILSASHIGNIEDLVNAINSDIPLIAEDFSYEINAPKQEVTHHLVKGSFYKRFTNLGKLTIQYDYQNNHRFEFDKRVGDDRDKPAVDLRLQTHSLSSNFKFDANRIHIVNTGLLFRYQDNFANPETGIRRLIPDYQKTDLGAYITYKWRTSDKTTIDAGLRYDFNRIDAKKFYLKSRWEERNYDDDFSDIIIGDFGTQFLTNPVFDYHNVAFSAGIKHQINNNNQVLFNYSLAKRAPNPSELFSDGLHHAAARIELGDLRTKQETSNRFAASYQYENNAFTGLLELFYNHVNDYIFIAPSGTEQTIRGAFPVWNYLQTNAALFGLDATLMYTINDFWSLRNTSSFTYGDDLKNNEPLIDIPPFTSITTITYTNEKWLGLETALKSEWVGKQTRFPNNNFEQFIATTNSTALVDISTPPSGYHLFHFNSSISGNWIKGTNTTFGVAINNILNTHYRDYLNRQRYFADNLGRNIQLQIHLNF